MSADDDDDDDNNIRILICSGNLGNAPPDEESWNAWVPENGLCQPVLQQNNASSCNSSKKYPIRRMTEVPEEEKRAEEAAVVSASSSEEVQFAAFSEDDVDMEQDRPTQVFDIIVFGLQESTFGQDSQHGSNKEEEGSVDTTTHHQDSCYLEDLLQQMAAEDDVKVEDDDGGDLNVGGDDGDEEMEVFAAATPPPPPPPKGRRFRQQTPPTDSTSSNTEKSSKKNPIKKTFTHINSKKKVVQRKLTDIQNLATTRDYTVAGGASEHHSSAHGTAQQWLGGTQLLHSMMASRLPSYKRTVSYQRGEMRLEILVHKSRVNVDVVHVKAQNTGRAGLANKGGIVAEVLVNDNLRLGFCTAHLEAHEGHSKYQTRVSTLADILSGTKEKQHDMSLTSHASFVMGDLNFRTELPNHEELSDEEHKQLVRDMVAIKDWEGLNDADELHRALRNKECLVGYQTLFCNFPPTFKVERQVGYQYIDKRRPSYTDRVLWKTNHKLEKHVRPLVYEPIDDFSTSDHKPIRAAFTVKPNQPFMMRPKLSRRGSVANLFKRSSKKKSKSIVAHKERFHLFISDMECDINSKDKTFRTTPNPYVCLYSDPPDLLKIKVRKGWKRVSHGVKKVFKGKKMNWNSPNNYTTPKGYRRSSILKQTLNAIWEDEEIHAQLMTHTADGAPLNLSGSFLRISVIDARQSTEDVMIGTCAHNLQKLIQKCLPSTRESLINKKRQQKQQPKSSGGQKLRSQSVGWELELPKQSETGASKDSGESAPTSSGRQSWMRAQRRMSLLNIFRTSSQAPATPSAEEQPADEETDPIETVIIDEPILKNGVETGRLRCKIEAWWMDENTAKAFGSTFLSGRRASAGYGTTADGRQMMLSQRRSTKLERSRGASRRGRLSTDKEGRQRRAPRGRHGVHASI